MSHPTLRLLLLLLVLLGAAAATASPGTLGYQGRLASAGGTPVTATLAITFRLYDVPSGGSALWSETQPAVDVDGGNLAVELGSVTPLPRDVWGRQLYLGVQVAGDSEMLPRPALTAAPFALRAAGTMRRTVEVPAEGTPTQNGAALLAAVAAITDANAASPVAVELDAGTFDLGTAQLVMPSHTTLAGRSQAATLITSAATAPDLAATVRLSAHGSARDLTVRNTAAAANPSDSVVGLGAYDPDVFQATIAGVSLERVTGESIAAPGAAGQRAGISVCVTDSQLRDVTGRAEGGLFAMGLRSDCAASSGVFIDGAKLFASGATDGLRGAYLSGGGPWRDIHVFIETNATVQTVYGLRVFANSVDVGAVLLDPLIAINGNDPGNPTSTGTIDALRLEYDADIDVRGLSTSVENVRGQNVRGVLMFGNDAVMRQTSILGADLDLRAVQDAALGPGALVGIQAVGATPRLEEVRLRLRCLPNGFNDCIGVRAQGPGMLGGAVQPGPMLLAHSRIEVAHEDPFDGSARALALETVASAQIQHSQLRVRRSPDAEQASVLSLTSPGAAMQVQNSSLVLEDAAGSNDGCLLSGPIGASAEWFANHLQGQRCDGGQVTLTCAGNTRRGSGFLASTCP